MQTLNFSDLEQTDPFKFLQLTLRDRWQSVEGPTESSDVDILVIPSLSIDQRELKKSKVTNTMKSDYYSH